MSNSASLMGRDQFVNSFDLLYDKLMNKVYPGFGKTFGVDFFDKASYPKCDIYDNDKVVVIEAAVPGATKKDLSIDYNEDEELLTISCESLNKKEDKDKSYIYKELKRSSFRRIFRLSDFLDGANIKASLNKGILTLEIPKLSESKLSPDNTYKIEIEAVEAE